MNIVLLVIDTLRAKNLPIYGYEKDTAPFLTKMAEKHTYAENYYSNAPWTLPSHATIFTGQLPHQHGTTGKSATFKEENKLVKKLNKEGYKTIGISENPILSPELNFDKNFDNFKTKEAIKEEYHSNLKAFTSKTKDKKGAHILKKLLWHAWYCIKDGEIGDLARGIKYALDKLGIYTLPSYNDHKNVSEEIIDKAEEILQKEDQTFLFLNLMPVHIRYSFTKKEKKEFLKDATKQEIERATRPNGTLDLNKDSAEKELKTRRKAYDAAIKYTDRLIEKLYKATPEDTVFVITSDHGELHGEYKHKDLLILGHHFGTFKEQIEAPLIILPKQDIELEKDKIYDHTTLHKIIHQIANIDQDKNSITQKETTAEYYSRANIIRERPGEGHVPNEHKSLYERKSFSHTNKKWKYDHTTDGEYLWKAEGITEKENLIEENTEAAKNLKANLQRILNQNLLEDINL